MIITKSIDCNKIQVILKGIKKYRQNFKNWAAVYFHIVKRRYPITVKTRDGTTQTIYGLNELFLIMSGFKDYSYDAKLKKISLNYQGKQVEFYGSEENGDLPSTFVGEDYRDLSVKDEVVIDIGANIGDTAVYFILNSAKSVIAVEPFELSFQSLIMNLKLNNMDKRVRAIQAGISSKDSIIKIPIGYLSSTLNKLNPTTAKDLHIEKSVEIPIFSLKGLLDFVGSVDPVLKMDCEGCEYDVILNSDTNTIRKVKRWVVEYHYDYLPLISKFQDAGFKTKVVVSEPFYNRAKKKVMTTGILYAFRQ
ncbi:MAG: FkbM family methyltransferase [Thermoplasmatales archaeon]